MHSHMMSFIQLPIVTQTQGISTRSCLVIFNLTFHRNGWGASAIDALSTAIIMESKEIVDDILDWAPTINFDQTDSQVSLFETTIRYVGGLLAGKTFSFDYEVRINKVFQVMISSKDLFRISLLTTLLLTHFSSRQHV